MTAQTLMVAAGRIAGLQFPGIPMPNPIALQPIALSLAALPVAAQVTFTMLPVAGREGNIANAISGDGSCVVGSTPDGPARWVNGVPHILSPFPGGYGGEAHAVSHDGRVVAGMMQALPSGHLRAFRWAGTAQNLGVPMGWGTEGYTFGLGVSGDGQTVVGFATGSGLDGFVWSPPTGMRALPRFTGGHSAEALAVSSDGSTSVGRATLASSTVVACRWRAGAIEELPSPAWAARTGVYAVNADGSVSAGYAVADTWPNVPERATLWSGVSAPRDLGLLPGDPSATVRGMNARGDIVVGFTSSEGPWTGRHRAFVWTASLGMVDLRSYLEAHGANLDGWESLGRTYISADGRTLAGTAARTNGFARAWIATIPPLPTCQADCDTSTGIDMLDIFDFLCFQNAFAAGCP